MEITPYFDNIDAIIINDIKAAKHQILLAMAWFTDEDIFDALLEKMTKEEISAQMVVINDNINNHPGGLDFQKFISAGGKFYFAEKDIPMHNKYIIIDSDIVITGSYNYTYYAKLRNNENVIRIKGGGDIIQSYIADFDRLVNSRRNIENVKEYLTLFPPCVNMFSSNNYGYLDSLYKMDILSERGQTMKAKSIGKYLSSQGSFVKNRSFIIRNVIYQQWKSDYYIDRINVDENTIRILFRTMLSGGSFVASPKTRCTWLIRSSERKDVFSECDDIENISVNNKVIIRRSKAGTIYYFTNNVQDKDFSDNSCGYNVNEEKQMVDENGNLVPVEWIKISEGDILTCEVLFKSRNDLLIKGTIDFIEGKNYENDEKHWNAFKIQMNLNREPYSK